MIHSVHCDVSQFSIFVGQPHGGGTIEAIIEFWEEVEKSAGQATLSRKKLLVYCLYPNGDYMVVEELPHGVYRLSFDTTIDEDPMDRLDRMKKEIRENLDKEVVVEDNVQYPESD
jgi:hypothetical protein